MRISDWSSDVCSSDLGVFLAGSGGRENTNFSIRGQSKALAGNSAAAVISYFAEVPSPTVGSSIPTYDLGSVQVLKGPQGTLFGRSTTGGAILYYPTAPSYELEGRSEEHTSDLQSLMRISYAVFCLKKKNTTAY